MKNILVQKHALVRDRKMACGLCGFKVERPCCTGKERNVTWPDFSELFTHCFTDLDKAKLCMVVWFLT